jgi:hypothetical protein
MSTSWQHRTPRLTNWSELDTSGSRHRGLSKASGNVQFYDATRRGHSRSRTTVDIGDGGPASRKPSAEPAVTGTPADPGAASTTMSTTAEN